MSAAVTSIVGPNTPTGATAVSGGVASIPPSGGTISPKAFTVEARLELSLDELIKERRKESKKEKKHASVKKATMAASAKTQTQTKQQKNASKRAKQAGQRSALVNKNRGLPAVSSPAKRISAGSKPNTKASQSKNKKQLLQQQQSAGRKHATAQKQKPKQTAAAPLTSKKNKNAVAIGANKQSPPAQTRNAKRVVTSPKVSRAPRQQQQQQLPKTKSTKTQQQLQPLRVQPQTPMQTRRVVRAGSTAAKICVTIQQAPSSSSTARATKQPPQSRVVRSSTNSNAVKHNVLPAKIARNFSSRAAERTQHVLTRVTTSRKQSTTSKRGAFVVRKPFASRRGGN